MDLHGLWHHKNVSHENTPHTARVLFVDDSDSDIAYVQNILKQSSVKYTYEIHSVPTLLDALRSLKEQSFDLILLDLNLLDISGLVPVSALHAEVPNIPILVYSGVADAMWREKAIKTGATGYLVKGCDEGMSLGHTIEKALNQRAAA